MKIIKNWTQKKSRNEIKSKKKKRMNNKKKNRKEQKLEIKN